VGQTLKDSGSMKVLARKWEGVIEFYFGKIARYGEGY